LKYENQFDAILSSLAIHHISREEQRLLYSKILSALKKGGVFFNADILKSDNKYLNQVYMDTWTNFMSKNYSAEEIEKLWLSKHQKEDNPQPLTDHLRWLKEAGFLDVDVIWKYYYFGVYGGKK
jgi:tRNA (cmo5U34)-methyltransferase